MLQTVLLAPVTGKVGCQHYIKTQDPSQKKRSMIIMIIVIDNKVTAKSNRQLKTTNMGLSENNMPSWDVALFSFAGSASRCVSHLSILVKWGVCLFPRSASGLSPKSNIPGDTWSWPHKKNTNPYHYGPGDKILHKLFSFPLVLPFYS